MLEFMDRSLNPIMAAAWMLFPGVALRKFMTRRLEPLADYSLVRQVPAVALAKTIRALDRFLYAAIAKARAESEVESEPESGRVDVLSLLTRTHEHMSDEDLRDELMAILVAGHETTSTTLDWVIVEACTRPAVMAKLRAEVDRVVGRGPVRVEQLSRLVYLRAVINECLRLHPPVPSVGRFVAEDVEIAGVHLPAGVVVSPSITLLHLDPSAWPEPRRFRPERFLDASTDRANLIPFGGGARTCLGKPFGMFQLQVVLATLLARFELRPVDCPAARLVQRGLFTGVSHPVDLRLGFRARPDRGPVRASEARP
jgi:cytochrome P450